MESDPLDEKSGQFGFDAKGEIKSLALLRAVPLITLATSCEYTAKALIPDTFTHH